MSDRNDILWGQRIKRESRETRTLHPREWLTTQTVSQDTHSSGQSLVCVTITKLPSTAQSLCLQKCPIWAYGMNRASGVREDLSPLP